MKRLLIALAVAIPFLAQEPEPAEAARRPGIRLPSGKMQQDEILKAEYEKSLEELAQLIKIAEQLQDELTKNDRHVLSLPSLKKAEEIEKLAKRIRGRIKK